MQLFMFNIGSQFRRIQKFLIFIIVILLSLNVNVKAQPMGGILTYVEEQDGTPSGVYWKLIFPNDTVTDNGDGTVTISVTGTGGGDITDVGDATTGAAFTPNGPGNVLYFEGPTADDFETILQGQDVSADVTLNLPTSSGTLLTKEQIDTEAEFESLLFSVVTPSENDDTLDDLSDNSIGDLSDVTVSSPSDGQLLKYNGTSAVWENWTPNYLTSESDPVFSAMDTEAELESQLTDVTNVYTNNDGSLSDDDLSDNSINDLSDVDTTGWAENKLLKFNASGKLVVGTDNVDDADSDPTNELQNIFQNITDGTNTATADTTSDTFTLEGGAGISISVDPTNDKATITNTGDTDASDDLTTSTSFSGDISGTYDSISVNKIKGKTVDDSAIGDGKVLKYNAGTGNIEYAVDDDVPEAGDFGNAADLDANGNILAGAVGSNEVADSSIAEVDLDINNDPTDGYYLRWNDTAGKMEWASVSGAGGDITAVGNVTSGDAFTADGSGNVLYFEGPTADAYETILQGQDVSSDITVNLPTSSGTLLTKEQIDTESEFESLLFSVVTPSENNDTLDNLSDNSIGDLSDVDTTGVADGKVLKYNAGTSKWEVADDADTTYSAGTGLSLSGTTFTLSHLGLESLSDPNANRLYYWNDTNNTTEWLDYSNWDTDKTDDLTTSTSFSGDVSGPYNNLQLGSGVVTTTEIADGTITNADIADDTISEAKLDIYNAPTDGYYLKWDATNGMMWAAVSGGGGDITAVGDVTSGDAFTPDGGGNELYFEGATADDYEIKLTAQDPTADYTITLPAATGTVELQENIDTEAELEARLTDVTNVYTNNDGSLTDDDLSDNSINDLSDIDTTGVADGKILKYNGTSGKWEIGDDADTTYSAGTGLALSGTTFSLSHLGLENLTDPNANRLYYWDDSTNTSAWLDYSNWDTDKTDDLTTSTSFGGDVSGTYDNLQLGTGVVTTTEIADGTIADGDINANADVRISAIEVIIDGGGSAITTGVKADVEVPFNCTILQATALADQTGSIQVDIWKDTYANFPPTDADSITGSNPITISSSNKSQDSTLSGWTTTISAGDILRFNIDSCSTITRCTISLKVRKD